MVRGKKFLQQIGIIFVVSLFAACAGQESTETGFGISSISPAEDAEDVSVGSSIRVGFSGAIDQTSLNAYTLRVEEVVSQSLVEGKVTWDGSSNTAIFKPYMPLPYWTDFRVIVSDKIRSSSGVHVGQAREWWFTTVTNDHQFSTRPAANATGVSPDSIIRVQFAHGTDMNTVTDSNFNVYASTNPGNSISGTLEADTEDDTYVAIFYPDFSLATNTGYTIEFGDGIMQNGSSAFPTGSANKTISFTTGFSSTNSVVMGTIQDDYSYNIETLSNGYLVIAGETWGYFTDNASGEGDGLIAIYDQSGEEIVVHQFGGMTPEAIYDMTVIGNNIYVTGYVDTYDFNDELAERQTFIKQFTFNQNSETIFESWSQTIASNDS
ncbi:MAG: Ig-like domain-containing protein, partial [Gammaproteobacteria bacterium]|nr:Ig-like domain-containing protein [Gammaproteobacteria bacterium]